MSTHAIKPVALAVLTWAAIMAGIAWGLHHTTPCPTTPPRITTRTVTRTVYQPMPMPTPATPRPVVITVKPGIKHTLCMYVNGKGPIDPVGLQDCWGAPDQTERSASGKVIDPY